MIGESCADIALVDNDVWSARLLSQWISGATSNYNIAWVSLSGAEALHRCLFGPKSPTALIVDMALGDINGDTVCRRIRQKTDRIGLLCITAYSTERYENDVISAGAQGLLAKENLTQQLLPALNQVSQGKPIDNRFLDSATAHRLLSRESASIPALSNQERDILKRYKRGQTTMDIAEDLGISHNTVFTHVHRILRKLKVNNRDEALTLCDKYDLL